MADKTAKTIKIQAGADELTFKVALDDYHAYQNAFMPDSKVAPSANFLKRTVADGDKETLEALMDQGLTVELAGAVAGEFKPALEITVKK